MQNKYLIISPCYNIGRFAAAHVEELKSYSGTCDLLLIDDHSADETQSILMNSGLPVHRFEKRSGKAEALRYGFEKAIENRYEAVITIDSDMQHPHQSIADFIECYEQSTADYIIGKRDFSPAKMPLSRILSNRLSSMILSRISSVRLEDSQCGFRLIDRRYLLIDTNSQGFQFESEHLVKSIWNGATIEHIVIPTIYNGALSSMKYLRDTAKFIRLFWQLMRQKRILFSSTVNEQV